MGRMVWSSPPTMIKSSPSNLLISAIVPANKVSSSLKDSSSVNSWFASSGEAGYQFSVKGVRLVASQ